MAFEHMNSAPPVQAEEPAAQEGQVATPAAEATPAVETPPAATPPAETAKPDTFIEDLNKRFGQSFKGEDDLKGLFETPKKISEYESKLKEFETVRGQADSYKKELEELRNTGYAEFLSKPLIKSAYVAQQLIEKYPDKDPFVLQEIAMSDVDKMDNLDVVAREMKIRLPKESVEDLKRAILSDLGVDADTKPEEWDSVQRIKLAEKAENARGRIKELTKGIEIPKAQTKEDREKLMAEALQKKVELTAPIKDKFVKFDEFSHGDFKFAVPKEFSEKLGDVFQGIFVDAGLEVNEQNLAIAEALKKAMFLEEYFPKIKEVIETGAKTVVQQKVDEELHNTEPPNTATATDVDSKDQLPGVQKFFSTKTEYAKKL